MARFVETLVFAVQTSRRQHANGPSEHGRFVTQDIAKHIARYDHVKAFRLFHQLHRCVVDIHMVQSDVRILLTHFAHHVFPELEGFEHIGFVHTRHTPFGACRFAFASSLESNMGNAFNLRLAVAHVVECLFSAWEMTIGCDTATAGLAEVNIPREFANDQNIQTRDERGFQTRCVDQLLVTNRWTKVGKKPHVFAQSQNCLLWSQRTV